MNEYEIFEARATLLNFIADRSMNTVTVFKMLAKASYPTPIGHSRLSSQLLHKGIISVELSLH